jgi:hypothetical protein
MFKKKFGACFVVSLAASGCVAPIDDTVGLHPDDVKPSDGAELGGPDLVSNQQAHELHYTDQTNQWGETNYPIGGYNPNPGCMNWRIYDRYLSSRPAAGSFFKYSTAETSHNWARGPIIDTWMATIPYELGYNKAGLLDHNTVVASRYTPGCTGRYVFQWDNRTNFGPFGADSYYVSANIPERLAPKTKAACEAREGHTVPSLQIELYVCEAPKSSDVTSIDAYCARSTGHWRRVGSNKLTGTWSANSCGVGGGVTYPKPVGKVAVSFNAVIKAGIGHAPAPADIWLVRYP